MSTIEPSNAFGGINHNDSPNLSEILKYKSEKLNTKPTKEEELGIDDAQGIVLYCDGGARPNPGHGGYGIHGYIYQEKTKTQGSGHPTHSPTASGYLLKANSKSSQDPNQKEIQVLTYIDAVTSLGDGISNNVAELEACASALDIAKRFLIKEVLIYSDSKYVYEGINKWIHRWIKFNWRRPDGTEYFNRDQWEKLLKAKEFLEKKGILVKIEWMYGHSGDVGNEKADTYATIGVMKSIEKVNQSEINYTNANQYWKSDVQRHPLLGSKSMYYLNESDHNKPGLYYMGSHGKDDEALGTRMTDGCFVIAELDDPVSNMEIIRNKTIELGKRYLHKESVFMLSNLDAIHRPETQRILNQFGEYALIPASGQGLGVSSAATKEILSYQLIPSRVAFRSLGALEEIDAIFRSYLKCNGNDLEKNMIGFAKTDLTDILFQKTIKVKKKKEEEILTLKSEYNVGFSTLSVLSNYYDGPELKQCDLKLILGVDLPNRNSLKRLESHHPTITLLTWMESETNQVFRYVTLITIDNARSIWSGHYSNYRYLGELLK